RAPRVLLAEADREAVAVLDLIVPALQPQPGALTRPGLASGLEQLVPRRHLGAAEALGEIAVDLARSVHRLLAPPERPGAYFVLADGEERDQSQHAVAGLDHE